MGKGWGDGDPLGLVPMPRFWIWIQAAIFVFVIAGMVIAVTKLA